ncbi:MAG: N-acetylmuramoyl-L-alanine amidase [Burkholderiales bacterium]|nr:N-acetylmuramoyl-L-alanine amidase [Phycisphaerae bacterium]
MANKNKSSKTKHNTQNKRRAIVFVSLIGVLTFTITLLLALAPAPLRPGMSATLFSANSPIQAEAGAGLDLIFRTDRPIKPGRWTSIFIHHSRTPDGNAHTVADPKLGARDHFVICNGAGGADGEIQINTRWTAQAPAVPPGGVSSIDPNCISICLIGDYDQNQPTPRQMDHLRRLTGRLQQQFDIPSARLWMVKDPKTVADAR